PMSGLSITKCRCGCGRSTTFGPGNQPRQFVHGHNRRGLTSPEGWVEQGTRFVWVEGKKRPLHRLIGEGKIGRARRSNEVVRHRDGDLLNNEPANLVVVSRQQHFELSMTSTARQAWSEEEKDDAVRLYCAGMTIDAVACSMNRSYSATRRLLARWCVLRTP